MINWKSKYLKYKLKYEKLKGGADKQNKWFKGDDNTNQNELSDDGKSDKEIEEQGLQKLFTPKSKSFVTEDGLSAYQVLFYDMFPEAKILHQTQFDRTFYEIPPKSIYANADFEFVYERINMLGDKHEETNYFSNLKGAKMNFDVYGSVAHKHVTFQFQKDNGENVIVWEKSLDEEQNQAHKRLTKINVNFKQV